MRHFCEVLVKQGFECINSHVIDTNGIHWYTNSISAAQLPMAYAKSKVAEPATPTLEQKEVSS